MEQWSNGAMESSVVSRGFCSRNDGSDQSSFSRGGSPSRCQALQDGEQVGWLIVCHRFKLFVELTWVLAQHVRPAMAGGHVGAQRAGPHRGPHTRRRPGRSPQRGAAASDHRGGIPALRVPVHQVHPDPVAPVRVLRPNGAPAEAHRRQAGDRGRGHARGRAQALAGQVEPSQPGRHDAARAQLPVGSFLDDQQEDLLRRERLVKGYMKLKHGVDSIPLDAIKVAQAALASGVGVLSLDEAIAVIQRNERGRQGRQRGLLVQELREEERQRKLYEAAQGAPEMDPDIAAANIQRMFRGFFSRAAAARERDAELVFIGMKAPAMDRSALEKRLADARLQRRVEQAENKEEYERALIELHGVVTNEEGPFMKEKMLEERRRWITDVMATGQLPEDLAGFYAALNGEGTPEELAKAQAKEEEEAKAKAAADKKGAKGAKGKKEEKKGGKGAKGKGKDAKEQEEEAPEKPPPLTGPSELCTKLAGGVAQSTTSL
ncbi:hypothetical protein ON010_g8763 [Phytophthora cinnamomi]|nr:hypothetical protein ON010_g8763 [Phytophthora cinnamomi]